MKKHSIFGPGTVTYASVSITSDHRISIRGGAHTVKVTQEMRRELGVAEGDKVVVTLRRRSGDPATCARCPKWITWVSVLKIRGNAHTISLDREIREDMGLADGDWVTVTISRPT
jgi:bifunctional DNA-binding transcriptional regulator/antitoxin component of YhaV-PrlF toxin-antitoxin module